MKYRDLLLVSQDNIIDFIYKRRKELTGIGKNTAVSVSIFHVGQGFSNLFDLPPFPVQNENSGNNDKYGNDRQNNY